MVQAITGGCLIDGCGGDPIQDAVVLIEDTHIIAVGQEATVTIPDGAEMIEASHKTVMPGLIDTHVHIMSSGGSLEQRLYTSKAVLYFQAANNLKRTLQAGFTTIRDAGDADAGLRQALEMGLILGPRLLVSGCIGQTGGLLEKRYPSGVRFVNEETWRICDGVEEVRKTMRRILCEHPDFIKIFATGGVMAPQGSPFIAEWAPSELAVIVEEATRCGIGVMAHAEGSSGIKNALRAGVTSIEHGDLLDQESLDLFLTTGSFLVPTLYISKILSEQPDTAWLSSASKQKKRRLMEERKTHLTFQQAYNAGVNIALGTDALLADMHGTNATELTLMMEEGGLSAMEAIVAGTRNAAECCLLGDRIGTLEVGKLADILLIDGNPLDDITVLQDANNITVYKEGKVVPK